LIIFFFVNPSPARADDGTQKRQMISKQNEALVVAASLCRRASLYVDIREPAEIANFRVRIADRKSCSFEIIGRGDRPQSPWRFGRRYR
jgi:hypothetical protein